jgi:acetyltransferase-like isoleucine patch superfamily enzyme
MKEIKQIDFPNVHFGKNVIIRGENVEILNGAFIGDNVFIESKNIHIGFDTKIEYETTIKGLGTLMESLWLGDNCFLGFRNQILVPTFTMKDYSQLHNSGLNTGYKPLEIGYNCWIGQNTILNSTDNLTIMNNVRIGTQSQLWTHVASGELLEGCTLYGNNALLLKDNVWLVGGAVISPGLVLEENSIIMTGSVLTRSTEKKHTYAGVPAIDITNKLSFWKEMTIDNKIEKLKIFVDEFLSQYPQYKESINFVTEINEANNSNMQKEGLMFSAMPVDFKSINTNSKSIFDVTSKVYLKQRTKIEIDWIKFTVGFRARFIPYNI